VRFALPTAPPSPPAPDPVSPPPPPPTPSRQKPALPPPPSPPVPAPQPWVPTAPTFYVKRAARRHGNRRRRDDRTDTGSAALVRYICGGARSTGCADGAHADAGCAGGHGEGVLAGALIRTCDRLAGTVVRDRLGAGGAARRLGRGRRARDKQQQRQRQQQEATHRSPTAASTHTGGEYPGTGRATASRSPPARRRRR
jgi:hypothetical protein